MVKHCQHLPNNYAAFEYNLYGLRYKGYLYLSWSKRVDFEANLIWDRDKCWFIELGDLQ